MSRIQTIVGVLVGLGTMGCVTPEGLARERAANEFKCPPTRVFLTPRPELSDGTFDVEACGRKARYTCIASYGETSVTNGCAREPMDDAIPR